MNTYYLHIISCIDPDIVTKIEDFTYKCEPDKEIFITRQPPIDSSLSFFLVFNTTMTYIELNDYFITNLQKTCTWVLIEVTNNKCSVNLPTDLVSTFIKRLPQSCLEIENLPVEKLPLTNLRLLYESYLESEQFEKCGEIKKIIDSKIDEV